MKDIFKNMRTDRVALSLRPTCHPELVEGWPGKQSLLSSRIYFGICLSFFLFLIAIFFFAGTAFAADPQDSANTEDEVKDKIMDCAAGWRQFVAAGIGYEDFTDYWRDLYIGLIWPVYFSDISNVENQLNKARYSVMATFLRCDTDKLKFYTQAYYRLEAELYFVRHYVDIKSGTIRPRAYADEGEKNDFTKEMMEYFVIRKKSDDPEKDKALFSGYFDLFAGKYRERVKMYTDEDEDMGIKQLKDRFEQMLQTFKDFGKESAALGSDVGEAGGDIWGELVAVKQAAVSAYQNPTNAIKEAASAISGRFKVCPATGHPDECKTIAETIAQGASAGYEFGKGFIKNAYEVGKDIGSGVAGLGSAAGSKVIEMLSSGQTEFGKMDEKASEIKEMASASAARADMLSRYELLYGQVGGAGVSELVGKMDELIATLGNASLEPLGQLEECADEVQGNVCM